MARADCDGAAVQWVCEGHIANVNDNSEQQHWATNDDNNRIKWDKTSPHLQFQREYRIYCEAQEMKRYREETIPFEFLALNGMRQRF